MHLDEAHIKRGLPKPLRLLDSTRLYQSRRRESKKSPIRVFEPLPTCSNAELQRRDGHATADARDEHIVTLFNASFRKDGPVT